MANVFTDLEQDALLALDTISNEQIGFINAVRSDFSTEHLAKDRVIRSFVAPQGSLADTTPSAAAPDTGDQTFTNKTLSITKDRHYAIRWTAEDLLQMNGGGPGANSMMQDQIAQGMRTIRNELEADIGALGVYACRAHAPLGTNLFDSTGLIKDVAAAKQILVDNGAPTGDMSLVVGSDENVNLLGIPNLYKANEAADVDFLRNGVLGKVFDVKLKHSAQVDQDFVKGTGASYLLNDASSAVGDTVIAADTGSGTIIIGDIVSFAGDANKYVVTAALAAGSFTIAAPGLRVALADDAAITVANESNRNMLFDRNAIAIATRLPVYIPGEEDQRVVVQDPKSGLAFQILTYMEHKRMHMQIGLAWGVAVMKPEHLCLMVD